MKQEERRQLTVHALYALIPLLLVLEPKLLEGVQMQAYGAAYNAYLFLTEFGVVALPALIWFLTKDGRKSAEEMWLRRPGSALLLVIPLAVCAYFAVNGLTVMWFLLLNQFGITQMPQSVPAPQNGVQMGLGLALIAATPALCEEFFFRGVLQPVLHRQMKPWAAIVLCGCMFGLAHGNIVAMPAHVLLGILFCFVAYWTRSLWYTLLWHFLQNGIAMVLSYFSETILQMNGGADASAQMLAEQPMIMLLSSGMMFAFFGLGAALFLALLLFTTHNQHKESAPLQTAERKTLWTCAPLAVALICIVYMYVTGAMALMGGGA